MESTLSLCYWIRAQIFLTQRRQFLYPSSGGDLESANEDTVLCFILCARHIYKLNLFHSLLREGIMPLRFKVTKLL
jgi:hypothetical protein